jgi:hypothetical protein
MAGASVQDLGSALRPDAIALGARRSSDPTAIAFIDTAVADYQQLAAAMLPNTAVFVLDPLQDAVGQITQTLLQYSGIASVHIISHGRAGQVQLGQTWLHSGDLGQYAAQLQSWSTALTADADILLYGCDIGAGEVGAALIQQLAHLTGADIAASNNLTGNAALGGDWTLEVNTGAIAASLVLSPEALQRYQFVLPTQNISLTGSTQGNGDSWAVNSVTSTWTLNAVNSSRQTVSDDGRYVVFTSQATNLAGSDTNTQEDIFLYDRTTNTTTLVSAQYNAGTGDNTTNVAAAGRSFNPVMSADGRYIAFTSTANNLVANDLNGSTSDVFLWDRVTQRTTLISKGNGGQEGWGDAYGPSISRDGKRVSFVSFGDLLRSSDYNRQVFVYEWTTTSTSGAIRQISVNNAGQPGNGNSALDVPALISGDGRFVVFQSTATNLTPNSDTNTENDVFVRDLVNNTTTLVSVNTSNTGTGNQKAGNASISEDGRYVVFLSNATNLAAGANGAQHAFIRDLVNGTTQIVSVNSSGTQANSWEPTAYVTISGDGRYAVFVNASDNLVPNDANGANDVFVRDLTAGTTSLVSGTTGNIPGNGASDSQPGMMPAISYDGRYVVFTSAASNLVGNDTNGLRDVFLRDRQLGTTTLISQNLAGNGSGNGASDFGGMNRTGSAIAFTSAASNLVTTDTNGKTDVFVYSSGNLPPVAGNDNFGTTEDTLLSATVIGNDSDPDNNVPLTVSLVSGPSQGSLSLNANGTFNYTPGTNYSGTDTFTYSVRDSLGATSGIASVVLSVTATNDAPVAVNDAYTLATGSTFSPATGVLANDTDVDTALANLTASVVNLPNSGNLVLNSNGTFTYTPNAGFTGSDRFVYRVNDGQANSGLATVSLTVTATVNTPPIAVNDTATGNEDTVISGNVSTNDTDTDGNFPLSATLIASPTQGSVSLNPSGNFSYTPNANTNGTDTFTYVTRDALGAGSNTATVVLTINPVNDAPSFTSGANQTVMAGAGPQTIAGWASGFVPGPANEAAQTLVSYQVVSNSNPGVFLTNPSINASGTLTYTPVGAIANGASAVIGVQAQDSGGTANGGGDLSAIQYFTITVASQPTLSVSPVSQQEGNSGTNVFNFTVSLSNPSGSTVSVQYATADGTARVTDNDYLARNGTLTFLPGETTKVIAVPVLGDTRLELNETFQLNLSAPMNAQLASSSVTGTILNDDAPPTISVGSVSRQEGNVGTSNFWFTVSLSTASYQTVSVNYRTADGTATKGSGDYYETLGTVVFLPGETRKAIPVTVVGDRTIEQNETFSLVLSSPINGTLGANTGVATILNDDNVTTSDFNQDGINDIVWRNYVTGENQVWIMGASMPVSVMNLPSVPTNWVLEGVGDFNQDGNPDLVWREYNSGETGIWMMAGGSILSIAPLPSVDPVWQIEAIGDFNRDYQPDILWRETGSGTLAIWYMNGSEISLSSWLGTLGMDWSVDGVADINNDGQLDILWRYKPTGVTGAWLMYGTAAAPFYNAVVIASPNNPTMEIAGVGDFNRDGKTDLIWRNTITGNNLIWFMDGPRSVAQVSTQGMNWQWVGI